MRQKQIPFIYEDEDYLMTKCASKIIEHLEKNIVKYRDNPRIANRLSSMNKYIHLNYILNEPSAMESRQSA